MPSKSTEPSSGEMMVLRLADFCLGSSLWSGGHGKIQRQRFCPWRQCQPARPGGRENASSRCQQECQVCGLHFAFSFTCFSPSGSGTLLETSEHLFSLKWEGLWAASRFHVTLHFSDGSVVLIFVLHLSQTTNVHFPLCLLRIYFLTPLPQPCSQAGHVLLVLTHTHTPECHSFLWVNFAVTHILLAKSVCSFLSHLFFYFLILFFLFYAPSLLCPAIPKMRSYLYLEKYPWTSKQKDPQSFSSFPNWLIISWILYYINCSFKPYSVVWQPFHYSNGELILTQRGMLVESWLHVSQSSAHLGNIIHFPICVSLICLTDIQSERKFIIPTPQIIVNPQNGDGVSLKVLQWTRCAMKKKERWGNEAGDPSIL